MKIRLIQKDINNPDYKTFLDDSIEDGPDIVCFPELTTSGCLYDGGSGVDFDGLTETLSLYPFAVFIGFPRADGGCLYNSQMYFRGGKYQIYDKVHLFEPMHETLVYTPGKTPGLMETEFGTLGVAICNDIRFSELFEQMAHGGAKLIFVAAAFRRIKIGDWKELIVQRAIQTGAYVIGVNAVGNDGVFEFGGSSMVAGPDGEVLVQADETGERVLDIDMSP